MNWLFWHSSDVFIQAHIETIYKLKKIFISKQVYVVNLHPTVMTLPFGDTLCVIWSRESAGRITSTSDWYEDSIWRSQRGRCCTESISTSMPSVPSAAFLWIVNVGAMTSQLVTSLYPTVSTGKAVSPPQGRG